MDGNNEQKNDSLGFRFRLTYPLFHYSIAPSFHHSCILLFLQDVEHLWLCSKLRLSLKNGPVPEGFSDLGFGLSQIAKDQRPLPAGLDTGGEETLQKPFLAKITFFNDALRPGWKFQVDLFDERPGILPVKASRSVGTTRHTVPASDATVKIHHYDAVFPFPGGTGRTVFDAGRIIAMITELEHGFGPEGLVRVLKFMFRKDLLIGCGPEPFDLFLGIAKIRDIVGAVTGIDTIPASLYFPAFPQVDGHGPFFPAQYGLGCGRSGFIDL